MEEKNNIIHNVVIQQCKDINMTGVKEVKAFDEETVVLDTSKGTLTIKGENLIINSFSAVTGDLLMQGNIWALAYSGDRTDKGFLRRLLK